MPGEGNSYRFTHAVVRKPCRMVISGLRELDRGTPDFELFQSEHDNYIEALSSAGLQIDILEALEAYPDSVFVEDAALCLPEGSIELRPGTPSRTGEGAEMSLALEQLGHTVIRNTAEGFIDGGDILVTESAILIGISRRTDRAGFDWLESVVKPWGYSVVAVDTPRQVLHFKSDCCLVDGNTILATHRLAEADCFSSFRVLTVPRGEEAAANSIRINNKVLVPDGFPATAELISAEGLEVLTVPVSQAALLDGGLSCMSLRFSRQ